MPKCEFCQEQTDHFRVTNGVTYYMCNEHYLPLGELVEYHRNKKQIKKQEKKAKNPIMMILHPDKAIDKNE